MTDTANYLFGRKVGIASGRNWDQGKSMVLRTEKQPSILRLDVTDKHASVTVDSIKITYLLAVTLKRVVVAIYQ